MTKIKSNKVVPAELDGMPIEVATEMLTTPKVKMTARIRKNCMAAREKVFISSAPIRRVTVTEDDGSERQELQYQEGASIDPEIKLARKASTLTYAQLISHARRMLRRRAKAQSRYLKLMQSKASEQHKQALGRLLTAEANTCEAAQDALETEVKLRQIRAASPVK